MPPGISGIELQVMMCSVCLTMAEISWAVLHVFLCVGCGLNFHKRCAYKAQDDCTNQRDRRKSSLSADDNNTQVTVTAFSHVIVVCLWLRTCVYVSKYQTVNFSAAKRPAKFRK